MRPRRHAPPSARGRHARARTRPRSRPSPYLVALVASPAAIYLLVAARRRPPANGTPRRLPPSPPRVAGSVDGTRPAARRRGARGAARFDARGAPVATGGPGDLAAANLEIPHEVAALAAEGLHPVRATAWAARRARRVAEHDESREPPENPPTPPNATRSTHRSVAVHADYAHPVFHFSPVNHVALESLLATHARAAVRVAVVGPELARDFRYANALGLTHFDRYAKLGFDARTVLVNAQTPLYATTDADDAPGRRWWELRRAALAPRHLDFLTFFGRDDADVLPAPALTLFLRLQSVWKRGGLAVDFTYVFVAPVPADARGFAVAPDACGPAAPWAYHDRAPPPLLVHAPAPRDAAISRALAAFDACGADERCADALARDPARLLLDAWRGAGLANDLAGGVAWLNCDETAAGSLLDASSTITLADAAGGSYAVWLGPAATDGRFVPAAPASPLGALFSAGPPRAVAVDQRAACAREIAGRPLSDRPRCFAFQRGVAGASRRFPAR